MDFVKGLGDTSGTLEIPVDAVGRAEVLNGRIRLTLITIRNGVPVPALCVVWTLSAFNDTRQPYELLSQVLRGALTEPEVTQVLSGEHTAHH